MLQEVKQYSKTTIIATFAGDTSVLKTTDFKITNKTTQATVPVKKLSVSKTDKSQVTIECFGNMDDGKEIEVVYDGTAKTFTATDGKVVDLKLSSESVSAGKESLVYVQPVDVNGVILDNVSLNQTTGYVTTDLTITKGYVSSSYVYLPAIGDTMSAKVTYHTFKFDTNGKELDTIEKNFVITAVDPTAAQLEYSLTIAGVGDSPAWTATSFKTNNKLKVAATGNGVFVRIMDVSGVDPIEITNYNAYSVSSSDKTKLLVNATPLTNSTTGVAIQGVSAGTAYVIVTDIATNAVVASLPVVIEGEAVATTLNLDRTSLTVVSGGSQSERATFTLKDQYDQTMAWDAIDVKLVASPANSATPSVTVASNVTPAADGNSKVLTIQGTDFGTTSNDLGTYVFNVTATKGTVKLTRSLSVTLVSDVASTTYGLEIAPSSLDTTVNAWSPSGNQTITVKVATYKNGAKTGYVSAVSSVSITNAKGETIGYKDATTTVTSAAIATASEFDIATASPIVTMTAVSETSNKYTKNLSAGSYVVSVVFNDGSGKNTIKSNFTISDSQLTAASYELVQNANPTGTVADAFEDSNLVRVYYDGLIQPVTTNDVTHVDGYTISGGGAFVKSVTLWVTVTGTTNKVLVTIPVNDQFANVTGLE